LFVSFGVAATSMLLYLKKKKKKKKYAAAGVENVRTSGGLVCLGV
jgi:hypothetical protein